MSIGRKVFTSSALLLTVKMLQRGLGFISMLVLARLLTPEDFGIFAIALLVVAFSEVMSNMGSWQYVIRAPKIDDQVVNTAWTIDVAIKSIAVLLIFSTSSLFSTIWNNDAATVAVLAMAPAMIIRALSNPQLFVERRNLKYDNVFKIAIIQKFISFFVVIILAIIFESFWAMIIGDLVGALIGTLLSYYFCSYRPRFSVSELGIQWKFSKWMLARGYVGFFRSQLDTLIISHSFSISDLGRFNIARELTVSPASMIIQPAFEPLLASFAEVQRDYASLARRLMTTTLTISIAVSPISVLLFTQSVPITDLLLGEKWQGTASIVQALSPLLFVFSISGMLSSLFVSIGKVKDLFYLDLAALTLLAIVLFACSNVPLVQFTWIRTFLGALSTLILFMYSVYVIRTRYSVPLLLMFTPMMLSILISYITQILFSSVTSLTLIPFAITFSLLYAISIFIIADRLTKHSAAWSDVSTTLQNLQAIVRQKFNLKK